MEGLQCDLIFLVDTNLSLFTTLVKSKSDQLFLGDLLEDSMNSESELPWATDVGMEHHIRIFVSRTPQ